MLELEIHDFGAGTFPADASPFVIGNTGIHLNRLYKLRLEDPRSSKLNARVDIIHD